jgi:hypothetical protein
MAAQEPVFPLIRPRKRLMLDIDEEALPPTATVEEILDQQIAALIAERDSLTSKFRPTAAAYRATRSQLTALRLKLGEKLYAMKAELAKKGRMENGQIICASGIIFHAPAPTATSPITRRTKIYSS